MKKTLYTLFAAGIALFGTSGCDEEFLEKRPSEQISGEQIEEAAKLDPSLLNSNIAGLYSTMYNTGTGGTDLDHDDFGQRSYDIYMDMISSDMVLGAIIYGWYRDVARYQSTIDYTDTDAYKPWRYYYRIIFGANSVIDALGGTDVVLTDPEQRHIMGQAKAMRAYAYFYLSHLYGPGYGDGTETILPIYTNTQVPNQPLSTSADVYNLIISDLEQAVTYLEDFQRTSKDQVDQWVARGLLAYAYAARGSNEDLQKVVTLTEDVINSGPFTLLTENYLVAKFDANGNLINGQQAGFNNVAAPSWMWGVDLTLASGLDLVSWWGQVDLFTYSYAWAGDMKLIDNNLYAQIRSDDIRKQQFIGVGYSSATDEYFIDDAEPKHPINKFFAAHRTALMNNKEIAGQREVTADYVYMRLEEMYLLSAEALARLDRDGEAVARLKQLLAIRIPDVSYVDGLAGQALEDEIYLQTRIELWGEGKTYLAMKRNKKSHTRGDNHVFHKGVTFSYDDPKLTFVIPQAEVLNNPVLTESE